MLFIVLALLGLCFGSFTNALVWRIHEQEEKKKLTKKQQRELSIVHGRSMCVHCKHSLAWYDLLPVLSWLSLKGKCRYCGKPIEDSPLVELLTAGLFVWSYVAWPYGWETLGTTLFCFWLVFLVGFMALAVYDLRWMLLPNRIVYLLIALSVLQVFVKLGLSDDKGLVLSQAFWGLLVIGGLFYGLFQLSKGKWIGGGDVKLSFMIGLLVGGPLNSILAIFVASFLGSLVSLPMIAKKSLKPTSHIPFGPFLLIATAVVYLYGARVADWYTSTLL